MHLVTETIKLLAVLGVVAILATVASINETIAPSQGASSLLAYVDEPMLFQDESGYVGDTSYLNSWNTGYSESYYGTHYSGGGSSQVDQLDYSYTQPPAEMFANQELYEYTQAPTYVDQLDPTYTSQNQFLNESERDDPWYYDWIPRETISYAGCTYFGTWCEDDDVYTWQPSVVIDEYEVYPGETYYPGYSSYTTYNTYAGYAPVVTTGSYAGYAPTIQTPTYQEVGPTVQTATGPLRCVISASPQNLSLGESVLLSWESDNAVRAYLQTSSANGQVGTSGVKGLSPRASDTFTLTVYNEAGQSTTCRTQIQVQAQQGGACQIAASPRVVAPGAPVVVRWQALGARSAALNAFGPVGNSGSITVYPYQSTTYELRIIDGAGKQQNCTAPVTVQNAATNNRTSPSSLTPAGFESGSDPTFRDWFYGGF